MADPQALKTAEHLVVQALLPFRDRLPADDVVVALLRCARVLLRKLPTDQQKALLPACRAYFEGKTQQPLDQDHPLIWTPN
jgi:hypothetical protein